MGNKMDSLHDLRERNGVDVWVVALDVDVPDSLSPSDRVRANRRAGEARRRFIASHSAVRAIVAGYLQVTADAVDLSAPYGQPLQVADGALIVSLAHTGERALVAVAAAATGVDIERLDNLPVEEVDEMAAFCLSPGELSELAALPVEAQQVAFLRLWTRKEAYLKACGRGIADQALTAVDVGLSSDTPAVTPTGSTLRLVDLDPDSGYVGALATTGHGPVRLRPWSETQSAIVRKSDNTVGKPDGGT
jgi:4'-phosphopantetheinyl transferase